MGSGSSKLTLMCSKQIKWAKKKCWGCLCTSYEHRCVEVIEIILGDSGAISPLMFSGAWYMWKRWCWNAFAAPSCWSWGHDTNTGHIPGNFYFGLVLAVLCPMLWRCIRGHNRMPGKAWLVGMARRFTPKAHFCELQCCCRCTPEAQWARCCPDIESLCWKLSCGTGVSQALGAGQIHWFEVKM